MQRPPGQKVGRLVLADRGPFRVEQCACGTIHLTIGANTVRLVPLAFAELTATVLDALDRLAADRGVTTQ